MLGISCEAGIKREFVRFGMNSDGKWQKEDTFLVALHRNGIILGASEEIYEAAEKTGAMGLDGISEVGDRDSEK